MVIFHKENHEWGVKKEIECLPIISSILDEEITHDTNKYNEFDYFSKTYNIEIKSRKVCYNKYETTFTTPIKRTKANKSLKKVLWIFNFTDGLYYLNFNEHKQTINKLFYTRYKTSVGFRNNLDIPINILKPFNKDNFIHL